MITNPTVFVLGAGANVPYGFSTGGGLIDKLRKMGDLQAAMGDAGKQITRRDSEAFQLALTDNLLPSIDAMLEHRKDLVKVGKRIMATILYEEEARARPHSFDQDWMSLVFTSMASGAPTLEKFAGNPVSFITFNYDRYLEHRFIRGLVARYNVPAPNAWAAIREKFVHLYGSLGSLPEKGSFAEDSLIVPLGAQDSPGVYNLGLALSAAEQMITIVHDTDQAPQSFAEALRRFQTAKCCLFMGFGYGKENVARLQTEKIPGHASIHCMTYGMSPAEINDAVLPAFQGRNLTDLSWQFREHRRDDRSINQFLRDHIQLLR